MNVTMLLCDAAQVADGKLYILGGGWSVAGPSPVASAVAVKIEVDWHEATTPHRWRLALEDADGGPVAVPTEAGPRLVEASGEFVVAQPASVPEGTPIDVALAVTVEPIQLRPASRYTWRLFIDDEPLPGSSLGFSTRPAAPA